MPTVDEDVDVIVLGVGGMGSAACYHLAARGKDVLGLERYDIPHSRGSSHGSTRIIRLAQYEHPAYVPLVEEAFGLWKELQRQRDNQIFWQTGALNIGSTDSDIVNGSLASCKKHGIAHEILDGEEVNERFPGFGIPGDYEVVYQPKGGFLVPEQCIIANVRQAVSNGADIRAREMVENWDRTSGVRVKTDRGTYSADDLIVTAGAWAGKQIPELANLLTPERQVMAWFLPHDRQAFSIDNFPVFVMDCPLGHFYGFPEYDVPGFKFAKFRHRRQVVDPDLMQPEPELYDELPLRKFAERHFPKGNGATMRLETCLFTHTPDDHFIIDKINDDVTVACGFSGHGFKFASVIGEILAELVVDGQTKHDIDLFRLDRFD